MSPRLPPRPRRRLARAVLPAVLATLPTLLPPTASASATWAWQGILGTGSGNWNFSGNWTTPGTPAPDDTANVFVAASFPASVTYNATNFSAAAPLGILNLNSLGTVPLTFSQGAFNLYAVRENIATVPGGRATYSQTAGINSLSNLYCGDSAASVGIYSLSGTGSLSSASDQFLGYDGVSAFFQSGGSNSSAKNVYVGYRPNSNSTYALSGGSLNVNFGVIVSNDDNASTFTQSGNSTVSAGWLTLADSSTSSHGSYVLSGGSLGTGQTEVGNVGTGAFSHTAGNHSTQFLVLGGSAGSFGSYSLSGTGSLSVQHNEIIGPGAFNQSAGTHSVDTIYLGANPGTTGSYSLSGTGSLNVNTLYVYANGAGFFTQSGGTATITSLVVGGVPGSYYLSGGALNVNTLTTSGAYSRFAWTGGTLTFSAGYALGPTSPFGPSLTLNTGMTLSSPVASSNANTLLLAGGTLAGPAAFTNTGLLAGAGTVSAPLTNSPAGTLLVPAAATLTLAAAPAPNAGAITLAGGTLDNTNHTLTSTGVISGHGAITNLSALINQGSLSALGGALTLAGPVIGAGSLYVDSLSSLSIPAGVNQSSLTAFGPVSIAIPSSLGALSFPSPTAGSLDLNSATLTLSATPIATLRQYLFSHQLFSSTANADPQHRTALAYSSTSPTLVKLTYLGDANLDGRVTSDDYTLLDRGLQQAGSTWTAGDFNYDGAVTSADYLLIDRVFLQQGAPLSPDFISTRESQFGPAYVAELLTTIPEPATPLLLTTGYWLLTTPRARRARL